MFLRKRKDREFLFSFLWTQPNCLEMRKSQFDKLCGLGKNCCCMNDLMSVEFAAHICMIRIQGHRRHRQDHRKNVTTSVCTSTCFKARQNTSASLCAPRISWGIISCEITGSAACRCADCCKRRCGMTRSCHLSWLLRALPLHFPSQRPALGWKYAQLIIHWETNWQY